jgi:VanZ family protein
MKKSTPAKSKKVKWIWVPAIAIVLIIFYLSSENGSRSHGFSMIFSVRIMEQLNKITDGKFVMNEYTVWKFDLFIRKLAHILEYAMLSAAVMIPFYLRRFGKLKLFLISFGLCFTYACYDEYHQRFIRNRSGRFSDVIVDCIGILLGITAFFLLTAVIRFFRKRSRQEENTA